MPIIGEIQKGQNLGKVNWKKYIWQACPNCGKERWVTFLKNQPVSLFCHHCAVRTDENRQRMRVYQLGRHLSLETREKMCRSRRGDKGANWKGGRIGDGHGYIQIWVVSNDAFFSMANSVKHWGGYIKEHRLIMARHLRRCLRKGELVHHLNGIRDDNRFENLALVSTNTHPKKTFIKQLQIRIRELEQLHLKI